jgi:hypothetical protein
VRLPCYLNTIISTPLIIINLLFLTSLAWRCENLSVHHPPPFPSYPPHHCPFTPVEPGYGVDLFEDDYLFLLPAADLRMDPALRPRPVFSVAFAYLYNLATQLNDGIFTVHRFSVATSARLRKSGCVFRLYVYGGIFDNPPRFFFFYLLVEQFVFGFVSLFFVAWDGRGKCEGG